MPSLSYLAILLGALLVLSRLPGVFYPKEFAKVVKSILKQEVFRVFSVVLLFFSISILLQKYDFTRDAETVMSVLGWLLLLGTILLAWFPDRVVDKANRWLKNEATTSLGSLLGLVLGFLLMYLGFYVY